MEKTIEIIKRNFLEDLEIIKDLGDDFSFKYKNIPIKHKSFKALIKFVNKKLSEEEIDEVYKKIKKIVQKKR